MKWVCYLMWKAPVIISAEMWTLKTRINDEVIFSFFEYLHDMSTRWFTFTVNDFFLLLLLLLQLKEHYLQNKTDITYNTTYNTSLDYSSYTPFHSLFVFVFVLVFCYTYVASKIQFKTGFRLASSIFLLLYLAAMWRSV